MLQKSPENPEQADPAPGFIVCLLFVGYIISISLLHLFSYQMSEACEKLSLTLTRASRCPTHRPTQIGIGFSSWSGLDIKKALTK